MGKGNRKITILPCGDRGLLLEFGTGISERTVRRIHAFFSVIRGAGIPGIIESIPGYRSILICYDPLTIGYAALRREIRRMEERTEEQDFNAAKKITIPVVYGGAFGPDLDFVARFHSLSGEQVIDLHLRPEYLVCMFGFTPGFPLLAGLPRRIATPRLKTPRLKVPAGSVGIGSGQTGVYPVESPGGWQLIGRTPLKLYDPRRTQSVFLELGDLIEFRRICEDEFRMIEQDIEVQPERTYRYSED